MSRISDTRYFENDSDEIVIDVKRVKKWSKNETHLRRGNGGSARSRFDKKRSLAL